jgi:hypothetical protein
MKSVNIEVSAHDAFLESPSSDTPKIERLERKIIYSSWRGAFTFNISKKRLEKIIISLYGNHTPDIG